MATLLDLKTRIIGEMSRDDLEDDLSSILATHIARACEYYSDTKFWFNSIATTVNTVAATATVAIPSTVRIIERITLPAYNMDLQELTLRELDDYTVQSIPKYYSYYNDSLRFSPIPDAIYTLNLYGIAKVAAPATDATENIWTTEAQDLIVGQTKMTLCRGVLRDTMGVELALGEVKDALTRLKRETARRLETPLRPRMGGRHYNINID